MAYHPNRGTRSRRALLGSAAAAAATTALASCDFLSTDPSGSRDDHGDDDAAMESPDLTKLVRAGQLPPLDERLPQSPLVVTPTECAGTYGGSLHLYSPDAHATGRQWSAQHEALVRWKPDFSGVIANVAEAVDIEAGGRVYVFHLRRGMRWSDGEPFTSADIVYAVNDVFLDPDLFPVTPTWLLAGDQPPRVEAPDRHTVTFSFGEPKGLFLEMLASPIGGGQLVQQPRHYLEQFHNRYNPDIDALAEDHGFDKWVELYYDRVSLTANPECPCIHAWRPVSVIDDNRWIMRRNPYYWKVDPDNRQLPYIDEIVFHMVTDAETALLQLMQGELHMNATSLWLTTLENKPTLAAGRQAGGYHFVDMEPGNMNAMLLALNLTTENRAIRDVFRNKDFRIGLSYAINRRELIEVALRGQGEPWQAAPREGTEFFDKNLAVQYTEFDVDRANEHLDRAGFSSRDSDGGRLDRDGNRIRFTVEVLTENKSYVDMLGLIKDYWWEVGIEIEIRSQERTLFFTRTGSNQHEAMVYTGEVGLTYSSMLAPVWYMPFDQRSAFAVEWGNWRMSGGEGEEPPAPARRQMELYEQLEAEIEQDVRVHIFTEILRIAREEFWVMGIAAPAESYAVVTNSLRNVPDGMPDSYLYNSPGPTNPEQYFFAEP